MRWIKKNPEPVHFINWKQNFKKANGREAVYDDLVGTDEYFQLKRSLLKEQGYICCYCEKQIGQERYLRDCDIEHFMPRHPDSKMLSISECNLCKGAQLTYTNLFISCKGEDAFSADHCNHKKDNWFNFKTCISPADPAIRKIFGFKLNGKIFVKNPSGQEMANHLNLNSYVLEEQRKAALDTVLEEEFEDEDLLSDVDYVEAIVEDFDSMHDGMFTEFCSMITYCLQEYYMP